jgi:hypothetical protein
MHEGVYIRDKLFVVFEFWQNVVPFPSEDSPRKGVFDFRFPNSPDFMRHVASLVKIVNVRDELDAVQRTFRQFLTGRRKRLSGIAISEPRFGWEQAKEVLESFRKLDVHVDVQLAVLISKCYEKTERPDYEGSRLSEL